ncbi:MAG: alanine racemase domain protein [Bacteroidetes bacterium]|nr:alanine racemase domain protein [Bacteroidota bacterium]
MSIADNLKAIRATLPSHVTLVCVSKFHPNESILEAYEAGARVFGENKVQEVSRKQETLPKDIVWHFIGHLQTNKIKYIAPFVSLIHSVDSYRLLEEIDRQAAKSGRVIDCLLQVHIAQETTKFGFSPEELTTIFAAGKWGELTSVRIRGLMGMATFTDDEAQVHAEFRSLKTLFDQIKIAYFKDQPYFDTLSMGMSDDYRIAVEEGSTMVRVGSSIFGAREY